MTTAAPAPITDLLRDSTRDLHAAAEHHEFQRALFKGRVSREQYAAYLAQMLFVHRALERHLRRLRPESGAIARVVHDFQFQEPYLLDDFGALGVDPASFEPSPATRALIAEIDAAGGAGAPLALLGFHYVLEGSNNGSKYIAVNIRKALDIEPGRGDRYLDPYGDTQTERWQAFKRDLAAVPFSEAEQVEMVEAARAMFAAIARISDDLLTTPGA